MEEKKYTVYMHENKINHKKYIGITGRNPEARWRNGTDYKTCVAFDRAIKKYGWDGFEHIILYTGQTKEEACEKEIALIKEYKTQDPDYGYNICDGGGGVSGMHHSEESKRKISEKLMGENNPNYGGKTNTPEAIEKRRKAMIGRKHTEEHKRKISNSLKGHASNDNVRKAQSEAARHKVIREEDGKVFLRVKDAAEEMGVTWSAISKAIRRNNKCGGYHWKYVESKA